MEDLKTTYHSLLICERHIIDDPRCTTDFCTNLSKNFAHDSPQILAIVYCSSQDNLRDYRNLRKHELLQIMVKLRVTEIPWYQQNNNLDIIFYFCSYFLSPDFEIGTLNWEHSHWFSLVVESLQHFFKHLN